MKRPYYGFLLVYHEHKLTQLKQFSNSVLCLNTNYIYILVEDKPLTLTVIQIPFNKSRIIGEKPDDIICVHLVVILASPSRWSVGNLWEENSCLI